MFKKMADRVSHFHFGSFFVGGFLGFILAAGIGLFIVTGIDQSVRDAEAKSAEITRRYNDERQRAEAILTSNDVAVSKLRELIELYFPGK